MAEYPDVWTPMQDLGNLAVFTKLLEELAEAMLAATRCITQGMIEVDPGTDQINRVYLENELADVWAATNQLVKRFSLDADRMQTRAVQKALGLAKRIDAIDKMSGNHRQRRTEK